MNTLRARNRTGARLDDMKSIGLFLLLIAAPSSHTQQPPAFSVATLNPAQGDGAPILRPLPNGFRGTNLTMHMLIANAYENPRIEGEPAWASLDRYDFQARLDSAQSDVKTPGVSGRHVHLLDLALQQLLENRCGLKVHLKMITVPAYALVVAGIPRLTQDKSSDPDLPNGRLRLLRGEIIGQGVSVGRLADLLSAQLARPVLDQTQLTGSYDFKLQWQDDESFSRAPSAVAPSAPSADDARAGIPAALERQLGLKLVSARTTVEVLVIDHLERPSAN